MSIKTFVFDCGGVLLRGGDVSAYARWEERLGLEPGCLPTRLWEGEPWESAQMGRISDAAFWQRAGAKLGLDDPELIQTLRRDLWDTWVVDEQVLSMVEALRRRYQVAMLSNSTDALEEILAQRYRVADRFEVILNSARLGIAKPDPSIYTEMLRRLEREPGEVLFIDDRAENVTAAAALGIHVAWFVDAAELTRQLAPYLGRTPGKPGDGRDGAAGGNGRIEPIAPAD
ncbi:MAG: HAD family phosphatase [Anaerolineae bacterium]|nr:HAD family phosphatase [Anaerolineae bacterium]